MKTLLLIVITLIASQAIYARYGADNPLTRFTSTAARAIQDVLETAQH